MLAAESLLILIVPKIVVLNPQLICMLRMLSPSAKGSYMGASASARYRSGGEGYRQRANDEHGGMKASKMGKRASIRICSPPSHSLTGRRKTRVDEDSCSSSVGMERQENLRHGDSSNRLHFCLYNCLLIFCGVTTTLWNTKANNFTSFVHSIPACTFELLLQFTRLLLSIYVGRSILSSPL